jgi:geranylgeranylglycerol-phosphate geranylgeranyltransferase
MARCELHWGKLALGALVATSLLAAGNLFNDCRDIETDRLNKPSRPLPAGQVSVRFAMFVCVLLTALGLGLSCTLGPNAALLTAAVTLLSFAYSWYLKRTILVGNITVSLLSALTVVFGGLVLGCTEGTFWPALIVFLFILPREVLKTIYDFDGDRQARMTTIAVAWGKAGAFRAYAILVLIFIAGAATYGWRSQSLPYALLGGVVVCVFLISLSRLSRNLSSRELRITLRVTKFAFYLGLLALFLGRLGF